MGEKTTVAMVTLGCARNEVDSEELAGRLAAGGFDLVTDADEADAVLVNTCGFIDAAKAESVETLLSVSGEVRSGVPVVAVGCMAERYGAELAEELPEAAAVLGFDDYPDIADRLSRIVAGARPASHQPRDRRELLPITPVARPAAAGSIPGHDTARLRLSPGPVASVKIASGCDRRCAFCAIPRFRGSFVSRPAGEILAEVEQLVAGGVREVHLVSENSTSYGKDLSAPFALPSLLRGLDAVAGLERVKIAYLQPAEMRAELLDAMAELAVVAPYFDLPFQHASGPLLRRMRRFGDADSFLALIEQVRARVPQAGIRSNVIVGFPGETEEDIEVLLGFLDAADLDAVGVFGYSDEQGTEGFDLHPKVDPDDIVERVSVVAEVAEQVSAGRADRRVGEQLAVLVDRQEDGSSLGHAEVQGPEDGSTLLPDTDIPVGRLVRVEVVDTDGVDLIARPILG